MSSEIDINFEQELKSFTLNSPSSQLDSRLDETLNSEFLSLEDTISQQILASPSVILDDRITEDLQSSFGEIEEIINQQTLREASPSLDFRIIDGLRELNSENLESLIAEQKLNPAPSSLNERVEHGLKDLSTQLSEPPSSLDLRIYEGFRKLEDKKAVTPFQTFRKVLNLSVSILAACFIISFAIKHSINNEAELKNETPMASSELELPTNTLKVTLTSVNGSVSKQEEGGVFYLSELPIKSIIETSIEHKRWEDLENNVQIEVSYPKTNVKFVSLPVD